MFSFRTISAASGLHRKGLVMRTRERKSSQNPIKMWLREPSRLILRGIWMDKVCIEYGEATQIYRKVISRKVAQA